MRKTFVEQIRVILRLHSLCSMNVNDVQWAIPVLHHLPLI